MTKRIITVQKKSREDKWNNELFLPTVTFSCEISRSKRLITNIVLNFSNDFIYSILRWLICIENLSVYSSLPQLLQHLYYRPHIWVTEKCNVCYYGWKDIHYQVSSETLSLRSELARITLIVFFLNLPLFETRENDYFIKTPLHERILPPSNVAFTHTFSGTYGIETL